MNRYRRRNPFMIVIAVLAAIGILSGIARNPAGWMIPIVVLGGVFLLYKFPPYRWKTMARRNRSPWDSPRTKERRNTKRGKFYVVRGAKHDDDDNQPKYH